MSKFGKGVCVHCGKEFVRNCGSHIYCSQECREGDARRIRDKVEKKMFEGGEWAECRWCGKWFKKPYKSRRNYCSPACRYKDLTASEEEKKERKKRKSESSKVTKKDGFTWDDVRRVFAEYGISSYPKAIKILEEQKKSREEVIT